MLDNLKEIALFQKEYIDDIECIRNTNIENLQEFQYKKIKDVVGYAYANSEFYKNRFSNIDLNSFDMKTFESLPYTTKEDLANFKNDILSKDINECAYYYETTGTTGPATPCPRGYWDTFVNAANVSGVWEKIFGDTKPVIALMGPNEIHSFVDTVSFACLLNKYCVFKVWPISPVVGFDKAVQLIKDYKIDTLVCTPGMAMRIYKYVIDNSMTIKDNFNIKTLIFTGEMMTEGLCRNISSLYNNALVLNGLYGSQEGFVMGAAGKNGEMYTFPNSYYYDMISVFKCPEKEYKELVLTMYHKDAKPLIKFRTGDLVQLGEYEENGKQKIKVIGRLKDVIYINGVPYCPSEIEEMVFKHITKCTGYRIELSDNNGDYLKLYLQFEKGNVICSSQINKIEEYISNILNIKVEVCIDRSMSDDILIGAMYGWKAARFKDLRNNA